MKRLRLGKLSLTARLTIFYTLATFVILLFAVVFQFLALTSDLEYEDNNFLVDKIKVVQAIIARSPDTLSALDEEVHWESAMRDYTRYMVRVLDKEGNVILDTAGMERLLPAPLFPTPATSGTAIGRGVERESSDGRLYLVNSVWASAKGDGHFRLLQIALDVTDEEAILEGYRKKMAFVFVTGLLLSAGLSILIARRGLRPICEITETAQKVNAAMLHERISERSWPRELTSLADAFDGMLDRLEGSFTRLSEFSANLAHELRTPINNLMGEAEVTVTRPRTNDEYRQVIESSLEEYHRLSGMIDNILFLARSEKEFSPSALDARREVEVLVEFYGTLAEEKGIGISCAGEAEVFADPQLFQRAVGNLISNAIRYTPDGGNIYITIEETDDKGLLLTVRDTGIGIDPAELPKVFDRFYRSDSARAMYAHGTGLGLSIVKSIVELHQGAIRLESRKGEGTIVTLRFPPRVLART